MLPAYPTPDRTLLRSNPKTWRFPGVLQNPKLARQTRSPKRRAHPQTDENRCRAVRVGLCAASLILTFRVYRTALLSQSRKIISWLPASASPLIHLFEAFPAGATALNTGHNRRRAEVYAAGSMVACVLHVNRKERFGVIVLSRFHLIIGPRNENMWSKPWPSINVLSSLISTVLGDVPPSTPPTLRFLACLFSPSSDYFTSPIFRRRARGQITFRTKSTVFISSR